MKKANAKYIYVKCGVRHPWSSSGWQVAERCDMAKAFLLLGAKVSADPDPDLLI